MRRIIYSHFTLIQFVGIAMSGSKVQSDRLARARNKYGAPHQPAEHTYTHYSKRHDYPCTDS
jgi:hypothetical protein